MSTDHAPICILGAGLTGLSTAFHLGDADYRLFEKESYVGGNCRTEHHQGFDFDSGGHIFYPKTDYVKELFLDLMGDGYVQADRQAWIYSHDTYTRYPFQANLYGLPVDVVKDCLLGLHDAHVREAAEPRGEPANFLEFIHRTFGEGIARHFMLPFNHKHLRFPLDQLTLDWMGKFVPKPTFGQVLDGSLQPADKCMGQNSTFMYPKRGGIQAMCEPSRNRLRHAPELKSEITRVDVKARTIEINGGKTVSYDRVLSTLPLPVLVNALTEVPDHIREAADKLLCNRLYVVSVAVDRPVLTERHRLYVPSEDLVFHKLAFFSAYAPDMAPSGKCAVSAEVGDSPTLPTDRATLEERVVTDLRKMGILKPDSPILFTHVIDMPYAYVVYDRNRSDASHHIRDWFAEHDIHCWGRYAEWEYQNMEKNILTGQMAADLLQA